MSPSFFVTAMLAVAALAAPLIPGSCDISHAQMTLPANQTALAQPSGAPSFVLLGVGVQNYTCSAAGTYASAGAVAQLFDISCLVKSPAFDNVQDIAFLKWQMTRGKDDCASAVSGMPLTRMGDHYFVTSPSGTGISPVWDFRAFGRFKGNANATVLAAKVANLPSPAGSENVDWLQLKSVSGGLATQIYRTDTRSGQPPASCTPGSALVSVKYTSKYWLFGSTVVPAGHP
ncbi:uncharacterized protein LACBIDRAFT_305232 [Laccaria bicolor S238N-H82]|uniref:Predicted protein n=1 Tax=Laccaria bicolor (strain S238N-H82 / ATCC MYA-4686) TaxID=486041 RepID=B0CTR3_LACBS|nr:uncharacterized protein LACBIDRAFT_305232 [Laccaria bicolor S238N-H82]EDR13962.1 predicted protein [Laccaria bicolor S238N-H82]|eukprot:XP_001874521.1 predicted protein [Laccaria bicolor S238N-H82]